MAELLRDVDTFVFDTACVHRKTGTLTLQVPTVGQILIMNDDTDLVRYDENQLLAYAAAAEYYYALQGTNKLTPLPERSCEKPETGS